ncbi:NADH-quinone oxidoreductase subunit H [Acidithiobacillus ferrivorans]|uniref:NADH-quinone oxidoreductase subunit H n=1 Tax=Acidithiobacillus ferrivorans TaxID=160808 RepID=UPI00020D1B24|nr:NADH-quinone oxidoreductase subunit H [Acidithiobacillus ferrivorans]
MFGDIVLQCGQNPSIFQPYWDIWKLFHKTLLIPESASWVFFWAPVVAFTAMLIVPMPIPVTNFPLPPCPISGISSVAA